MSAGHRCHDDGEVGVDCTLLAVVDRTGFQVGVCHSERFFNFEQLPVEPDDLLCGEIISVGFVAFDPGEGEVLIGERVVDLRGRGFAI